MTLALNQKTIIRAAELCAVLNAALMIANAFARQRVMLLYDLETHLIQICFFAIIPMIGAFLVHSSAIRTGIIMTLGSYPSTLVFILYDRFFPSLPVMTYTPALLWSILYEITFGLLVLTDIAAIGIGVQLFGSMRIQKPPDPQL